MAQLWECVPDTTGCNVAIISHVDSFCKAAAVLNNAIAIYDANIPNNLMIIRLPVGINIPNTLQALKERYSFFAGDYAAALTAANAVILSVRSYFDFFVLALNPVFESATATNNVFQPVDSTVGLPQPLAPDLADQKVTFYIGINTNIASRYRIRGFYATGTSQVPVYLPGEMMLIKAESHARQSPPDLVNTVM